MSTIRFKIKDIKKQIKEKESKYYWFLITPSKSVLIAKGNSKKETKNIVKEKIKKKPSKYENKIIRIFELKFRNEKDTTINSGTILILIDNYKVINNKLKNFQVKGKAGPVWFTKEWLNWYGWNKKYIVKMSEDLRKNKVSISSIGTNRYDREFKN